MTERLQHLINWIAEKIHFVDKQQKVIHKIYEIT